MPTPTAYLAGGTPNTAPDQKYREKMLHWLVANGVYLLSGVEQGRVQRVCWQRLSASGNHADECVKLRAFKLKEWAKMS